MLKKIYAFISRNLQKDWGKNETEFLPAALEVVETPPSPLGRMLLWTLFSLISIVLLWSIFGHVDEVAVVSGKLIPIGHVKTIQAEDKGVVKAIHVKEGQKVEKGHLLLELDTTMTAADVARIKKEIAYYNLEIDRLMAEQADHIFIPQKYPDVEDKDIGFQINLYQSRLYEYTTRLAAAEANIKQSEASLHSASANKEKIVSLYQIAKEKEKRIEQLVSQNAIATFVLFDHQAKRMELELDIVAQTAEFDRLEWVLLQSRESAATVKAERSRDIITKLVDDRKKLNEYMEELKKAQEKDRLSRILAPIDGRVSQLAVHTVGGIVTAAQPLMDVVPEDTEIQVEAWAANKDIGFIQQGQLAEVKIETFSFQKYGTLNAHVLEISPNAVEDKEKGRVYRVLLALDKNSFIVNSREVGISSGMTATGEIKIKQKRIIEFFLDPFRQYQSEALRER
jgi:hemolysin D